jgi:hypothetical protein
MGGWRVWHYGWQMSPAGLSGVWWCCRSAAVMPILRLGWRPSPGCTSDGASNSASDGVGEAAGVLPGLPELTGCDPVRSRRRLGVTRTLSG